MNAASRALLKRVPGLVALVRAGRSTRVSATRVAQDTRFHVTRRVLRSRAIDAYLRTHREPKLHLGTGANVYGGWLNTDVTDYRRRNEVVYLDARERFPLPDASFDLVFSEHMIEHLSYEDGRSCLRECYRVLRPGGRIRVATPSIDRLLALYAHGLGEVEQRYLRWSVDTWCPSAGAYLPGFVLNTIFRSFGHRFVYDRATLDHVLREAGFVDVEEWPVGESGDPRLRGLERHMRSVAELNAFETLVLEARRP